MATDMSDIVKQGYVRVKSKTIGVWQKRWIILRKASSKGPCRIEKYFDEKSARNVLHHKTAQLTNVAAICRLPINCKKYALTINFHDGSNKSFCCDSDFEADSWVKLAIQECLTPAHGLATGEPDVLSPGIQKELQEQFHVYLMPTPKLDVFGECLLQVTHENIYLWDIANSKLKLVAWPLTALRRYGSDPTKFTFEAGRHCATGEGMFVFHTLEGEKIYRKVHQATLAIAEAHHKLKKQSHQSTDLTDVKTRSVRQLNLVSPVTTFPREMCSYGISEDINLRAADDYDSDSDDDDDVTGKFIRGRSQHCISHRLQSSATCMMTASRCSLRTCLFK